MKKKYLIGTLAVLSLVQTVVLTSISFKLDKAINSESLQSQTASSRK
jgi:hypothetical protein